MRRLGVLDSGPLGLLTHAKVNPVAAQCSQWLESLLDRGIDAIIPEIVDCELRREFLRGGLTAGLARLEVLERSPGVAYLPLSTAAVRLAAELWADARRRGRPAAEAAALDVDVILAAQARPLARDGTDVLVATTNLVHLSLFVPAAQWTDIEP